MSKQLIVNHYQKSDTIKQIVKELQQEQNHFQISNLVGSSLSFVLSETFKKAEKPYLLIFNDKEEAAYYLNDLEQLLGDKNVLFYPGSYRRPYQIEETDNANVLLRSEVLNRINSRRKPAIIVTYPTALFEKVVTKKELDKNTLKIKVGENLSPDFVNEVLFEYQFNRVDFVTEPGDFSVRGGIIDVFSFSNDEPYRMEFFGDEVESIRTFDVETQLSKEKQQKVSIMPNVENKGLQENRESFLKYISAKTAIFVKDIATITTNLDTFFKKATDSFDELSTEIKHSKPSELFCDGALIQQELQRFTTVNMSKSSIKNLTNITFDTHAQPSFNKKFDLLIQNFNEFSAKGFTNYIFCSNDKQAQRFHDIFDDNEAEVSYETIVFPLYQGFVDIQNKIVCYTDHQIFERYYKFRLKNGYEKKQSITLQELTRLEIGDYVTHIDHGIGKFGGLQKIDVEGKKQEAIKLIYGDRDILYVSIHSLHKISKFSGKDGKPPKIYKLGSGAWKKVKQKTKARVKHIAFNLIQLYAKRKLQKGYAFAPDTHMQHELEASFIYEDTPDQFTSTQDVKTDMEKAQPMDRLVCGDVGFGKTEVAIRAAFKAVDNGKQVAILVPTTILAFQHFKTFTERLKDFPVTVDYLNRFRTTKQRNTVLEGVANGSVDIVIGTHQLTNKKIQFKDLGLLIIDEEQKFGVAIKDKLKIIKENVDTLTLTATPIPRTLQFSLMAARDLSVIKTAPPNRHPIETNVIRFSEETIRDAISYEISRGGQVFFIHNRIENIKEVAGLIQRLVPNAKICIGHGQMEGKKLEELMLAFMNGEFDVLVSTTIIESGLDVPNANTIFINNANNFGLSDLHQMRGRVGRSNKKAFCYFITPAYHMMTTDAKKRIEALELFSELGSGLNIAMKDLEIRGAGDLLGGEQSGFINDIGFDTYQKILQEAIEELKENEFKELYPTDENTPKEYVKEVQIETGFEILIPDAYVNSVTERLSLYNELGNLTKEEELLTFEKQIVDRFGEYPAEVQDLLDSVRIKWLAKKLGLEKIILKQKRLVGYFLSDQQSSFYETEGFTKMLQYVQKNPKSCVMKEKDTKNGKRLLVTFIRIDSVKTALNLLREI
ncbi:transcription-repair coupling factor [Tenacibaculum finnmarkense]|uniref:Transcription-repair-coupling factor n=1 Tax=Tenacibaculum finnmarkense genomovar finnmarkense TaxID=1458503 RepID=A0AAP1WF50_9FLAO|nr:transcription-repair coupling factor [Tenacibaculum finnmarkense]MBE7651729.1 transcription-repair coupling factor [Tenacibaculum finnmarkense genomovar finnmarkense]MBE7693921.1 transcription-repair coupling factor [Tenacibaculum finnmarkense genomovar finnmarkense]MCD8426432.1 transcription-repair coupling factor [Tenacibaculum finnmarkense genomovar finnmarkense]MCG8730224.1 transcription-repair coupling factor [Tenacibaculum finnmarkense]MCG8750654.1 transcription-repair coupling factor